MTVAELGREINAEVIGDASAQITSVATLEEARPGQVTFLSNPKYVKKLDTTQASAVIVAPGVTSRSATLLRTIDPYFAFMKTVERLHGHRKHPFAGIHPQAFVDPSASVGENTVVYPGAFIGPRTRIGRDCIVYPNVTIYDDCIIGDRVIIHGGTAVGVDGYGYATHKGKHHKIPQIGNVIIEDDVEIGSNASIERAALGSTIISKGTKIDQLVVIGHGVTVGEHCLIVAQAGVAGSVTMGHHVTLGGQVGLTGHIKLGDNVTVAAKSGVTNDVESHSTVFGMPAMPISHARRVYILFTQLPDLVERIKTLEQQVQELSSGDGAEVV